MAALMCCRASSQNLRHLTKILACQSQQMCYRKRNHSVVVQNCRKNCMFNSVLFQSRRQFCDKPSSARSDKTDETKSDKSDENSSEQNQKKTWLRYFLIGGATASFGMGFCMFIYAWGKPLEDAMGQELEDEYSNSNILYAYVARTIKEIFFQVKVTQEPSRPKLLPDPLTYPYIQPPYTLVIEMTHVLVNPEWTYKNGWRFKKRPGLEYFLRSIGPPLFEVVIFTKESGMTADPLITKIDPENFVMYRLYRDATRYQDGEHVKDLNCLNRDLSKVIMIDWNKEAYKLNPENGFNTKKWTGNMNDTGLGELAEFLRALAASRVPDVRPVLEYYQQFDDPMAQFHENQRKLKDELEKQEQVRQAKASWSMTGMWNKSR